MYVVFLPSAMGLRYNLCIGTICIHTDDEHAKRAEVQRFMLIIIVHHHG